LTGQKWTGREEDGYVLINNGDGQMLGIAKDSKVRILTIDGYAFKDFLGTEQDLRLNIWE